MKKVFYLALCLMCFGLASCDKQAENNLQKSIEGNYCEVTVLEAGNWTHLTGNLSDVSITYENGSGTNFGTYLVPQKTGITVAWTYNSKRYSKSFDVGTATKMTIVVNNTSASANY